MAEREREIKSQNEVLIAAAQDQALDTKSHTRSEVMKISKDPICQLCKNMDQTTERVYKSLGGTEYIRFSHVVANST